MIERLYVGHDDDPMSYYAGKINEIIDVVNALPQTGFSSIEAEQAALDEALDPHA